MCTHTDEVATSGPHKVKEYTPTFTQILSYKQVKDSGSDLIEKQYVFDLLIQIGEPCTRREIQEISGLPINYMTRVLKDLEIQELIKVAKLDTCRYTKRKVQFYSPINSVGDE